MKFVYFAASAAAALAAVPVAALAQHADHADHSAHDTHGDVQDGPVQDAQETLVAYRDALVARDEAAMRALFADDSMVFENGKAEGSFAQYMEHHLGPELGEITEFTFTNPTVNVRMVGHVAFGHETYRYRIALKDGRVIERDGVATSVLTHEDGAWKIVQYHSSSRAPRPN
ncbi:nuclear transport factor 2 family protein [Qipengyuania sp. 6B39]|uniref:YybH family protein n=1 Tax=Qipengyuania proteolytica TaxID=2867239 RepID=UPI001C8A97C1|nr:nuclear transport factor 2 family protein [Qipengyuania proteolytica]MBX7497207.1 nuclear transport factor 2 family protein [Qipengyuania proteolytica]